MSDVVWYSKSRRSPLTHERVRARLASAGWSMLRKTRGGEDWVPASRQSRGRNVIFLPTDTAFADYALRLEEAAIESGLWEMRLCEVGVP